MGWFEPDIQDIGSPEPMPCKSCASMSTKAASLGYNFIELPIRIDGRCLYKWRRPILHRARAPSSASYDTGDFAYHPQGRRSPNLIAVALGSIILARFLSRHTDSRAQVKAEGRSPAFSTSPIDATINGKLLT